jgi:RND family efflux transporter, MFP subunit
MKFITLIAAMLLLALAALGGWWLGRQSSATQAVGPAPAGRKVLYWYDPMKPRVHFDHPGPSPFMDMALQPKYADGGGGAGGIAVDPRMAQNLGLRVATVTRGDFARRVDTVGTVAVDQNRIRALTARASGYLERLDVRAVGDPIRAGQIFGAIYSPTLLAAQDELRLALQVHDAALAAAARQRLRLLGADANTLAALDRGGASQRDLPLVSPVSGVVTDLKVRAGDPVSAGMALAQIADLSKVWVEVQVPEAQAGWIATGNAARVTLPALPGQTFDARVAYVYPDLQSATRTLRLRLVLDNPQLALKPGMYAQVALYGSPLTGVLMVPDEAVLSDGARKLVMHAGTDGRYQPQVVRLGADDGQRSVVLKGLKVGDKVVVSGQFLIDAEANLTGALSRLERSNVGAGADAMSAPASANGGAADMKNKPGAAMPPKAAPAESSR